MMTREEVRGVDSWLADCDHRRATQRDERERQKTVVAQAIRRAIRVAEGDEDLTMDLIDELRDALQITVGVRR
jgi:hypothetical protein